MEVLLTCDDGDVSKTSINYWDPTTATKLGYFRGPPALSHTINFIKNEGIAMVENGKPFIHFWQGGTSLQMSKRILCPGKPGALAISPNGSYFVVAIDEKIYVWQTATGRIVSTISSAHYRNITVIRFTDDGSYFISGAQDGMILVWKMISIVSGVTTSPKYSWTDHSLPIADIHVGIGGRRSSVYTVSADRTTKIYSLTTGTLLLSVSFPSPLTTVVVDASEVAFYVGSSNSLIYQMKLHAVPRSIEYHITSETMADYVFKKHKDSISALSISSDGRTLASGDTSGLVLLWDTDSKQAIGTISGIKSKVTYLGFWLGNPESWKNGRKPTVFFPEVPKLVEQQGEDSNEVEKTISVWNRFDSDTQTIEKSVKSEGNYSSEVALSSEVNKLKAELLKSREINTRLHEFCLNHVLNESQPASSELTDETTPEKPSRKRKKVKGHTKKDSKQETNSPAEGASTKSSLKNKKRKKMLHKSSL